MKYKFEETLIVVNGEREKNLLPCFYKKRNALESVNVINTPLINLFHMFPKKKDNHSELIHRELQIHIVIIPMNVTMISILSFIYGYLNL